MNKEGRYRALKLKRNDISKANVGMLVHSYYLKDLRVRLEAETLVEAGYNVDVICLKEPKKKGEQRKPSYEKVNGVHIYRLPLNQKRGSMLRYFFEYLITVMLGTWKLAFLHIKNPFQVVHIHNMPDLLVLAGLIPKCWGAKLILDIHDPMFELFTSSYRFGQNKCIKNILKLQEKFSCWLAHRVISVNESMRENLESKGIHPKKIFILHNFPDIKYLPIKKDNLYWPRHKDKIVLLYAGTITEQYRLDVAIRATALASKHIHRIKLLIVGDGNDLDRILQIADKLGVSDCVEYMNFVSIERLRDIMKDVDVGISCHQGGLFGDLQLCVKILDYITQGLPVVSSRTRTVIRYIPEDAIFYFEPGNAQNMAEQIIKMWNNPDLVNRKIEDSKKLLDKYSWQTEKHKLINFYQEITKNATN